MSIALNLILASKAKSTHHKLALDALRHLRAPNAEAWREVFLCYWANYLQGAKAPDDEFKDFKNHVCHVSDHFWGGAVKAATNWYQHLLTELRGKNWSEAAYCAGVLSHYYTDPLMPFHTGQSESEGAVHRAGEWSVTKSYDALRDMLVERLGGWPEVELAEGPEWMRDAIHAGASLAHPHYDFLIDHYNLDRGVKQPTEGFDAPAREVLAQLLGYAAVGFSRILDRAIGEAATAPPAVKFAAQGLFASLAVPINAVAKTFRDQKERAQILAMYDEYVATGKCLVTMPEDDRVVRASYAKEVLKVSVSQLDAEPARKPGQQYGQGEAPRFVKIATPQKKVAAPGTEGANGTTTSPKRSWFELPPDKTAKEREEYRQVRREAPLERETASETEAETAPAMVRELESETPAVITVPKRSFKTVATQIGKSVGPGAKRAATAVVSLVGRFKPQAKIAAAVPTGDKKTRTSSVKSFIDRFRKKPAAEKAIDESSSTSGEAVEFVSVTKMNNAVAAVSNPAGKFHLELKSSVEDGPSVGPKMAARLAQVGVKTVEEFLKADPIQLGGKLGFNATASAKIKDWQDQARLVCRVPNLRGHDAQILVNCGIRDAKALATANAASLTKQAIEFAKSAEGQRLLRGSSMPDAEEVRDWIEWAQSARGMKAA